MVLCCFGLAFPSLLRGKIGLTLRNSKGVEQGYESKGGFLKKEAIMLLRRFYVQENEKGT